MTYPLEEIRLLCLLAVLSAAENFAGAARLGEKRLELFRRETDREWRAADPGRARRD